jgi:hypothetical protein
MSLYQFSPVKLQKKKEFKYIYSTAGHRQKRRTKHNPQQAAKNQRSTTKKH